LDPDALPSLSANALAAAIPDEATRDVALRYALAAALHEGRFVSRRMAVVHEIATAWSSSVAQVEELAVRVEARLDALLADALRPDRTPLGGPPLQRRDAELVDDPALVARFRALAVRPPHTFGRAFHDLYVANRFRFPGEPGALDEDTAEPHDSAHVLAAYATTPQNELLLATFIAAMRGDADVVGFPLTVLAVWHVGLQFDALAGREQSWLVLEPFAAAWESGRRVRVDLFGPEFTFWESIDRDVDELRRSTGIRPALRREPGKGHGLVNSR
jgi:hypothetical protein